jgi:serine/threonine protein phosphatase PrpC
MTTASVSPECAVQFAMQSDPGTERGHNEDACGSHLESATQVLVAVADGVSGEEGGDVASSTAIEVTLRAYRESPASWGPGKRLYRAAQQANIEIYDRALVVTELRRMSTTLTAMVLDGDTLYAAHVGDSRLYVIRDGAMVQKTKDHTVVGERRRMGLMSASSAKSHPKRSVLTRSLGRELIVAVDRIAFPVLGGDVLVVCSDGLYNVLDDDQIGAELAGKDPASGCAALVERSNARGTPDNLTVAVVQVPHDLPQTHAVGWRSRLARLIGS